MASLFCPQTPLFPFRTRRLISPPPNLRLSIAAVSRGRAEQEILRAVADSEENSLPCVRTFETDSARLALVGSVDFEQALTAAAADGGRAADEHLDSSMPAMVVETVFPGASDEHSTVSTRLFLPAKKVKEKARRLRRSLNQDVLSGTESKNILSMTFRQVVLEQLWSFELVVFRPGAERDMEDLENPREVSESSFSLGSSDERVISALAEAISVSAMKRTEEKFLDKYVGRNPGTILRWFQKPRTFSSKDSSVVVTELFEDEMVEYAKSLLGDFKSAKASFTLKRNGSKYCGWSPWASSKLEKIGGPRFIDWTNAYVPVYRIQIDSDKLKDVTFEGWREYSDNKWEVLLSHTQMVGLTDVLDMYYEDLYTLPNKNLSCDMVKDFTSLPNDKRSSRLLKVLSVTFATGVFIVAISALGQLSFPRLKLGNFSREHKSLPSVKLENALHNPLDDDELESLCIEVIKTIMKGLDWGGDIICEPDVGVWTGKLPDYFRVVVEGDPSLITNALSADKVSDEIKTAAQDIASYQVVLSSDGKVVGFQPTSRVGVNQWAANPLAAELYGGRKLSPSLLEPGLKIPCPDSGVVLIELLMSTKPDARFALARHSL